MKIFIICLLSSLLILVLCLKAVGKKEVFMVERMGKFYKELRRGLYFLIPFIDRVVKKIPLSEQFIQFTYNNIVIRISYVIINNKDYTYSVKNPVKELKKIIFDNLDNDIELINEKISCLGIKLVKLSKK